MIIELVHYLPQKEFSTETWYHIQATAFLLLLKIRKEQKFYLLKVSSQRICPLYTQDMMSISFSIKDPLTTDRQSDNETVMLKCVSNKHSKKQIYTYNIYIYIYI